MQAGLLPNCRSSSMRPILRIRVLCPVVERLFLRLRRADGGTGLAGNRPHGLWTIGCKSCGIFMIIGIFPDLYCCFFRGDCCLGMNSLWRGYSPLERGLRGVLRREARFGKRYCDVVFLGIGWLLLILGGCAHTSHTPGPSQEGRFEYCFFI